MIERQVYRDLIFSFRATAGFVIGAYLTLKTSLSTTFTVAWVIPALTALLLNDSFGGTLYGVIILVKTALPSCILVYVCQKLGMGFHNYFSVSLVFLIWTFIIGFFNPMIAARKLAILFPAMLFTSLVATPRKYIASDFAWTLLEEFYFAGAICLGVAFFVFPSFAVLEVQNRCSYALKCSNAAFELCVQALLANHKVEADVLLGELDLILKNMGESQENMNVKLMMSQLEPVQLLRRIFRPKEVIYGNMPLRDMVALTSSLMWHISSMSHALKNVNFNQYHAEAIELCRESFEDNIRRYQDLIDAIVTPNHVQDRETIEKLLLELKNSCDHSFFSLSQSMRILNNVAAVGEINPSMELESTLSDSSLSKGNTEWVATSLANNNINNSSKTNNARKRHGTSSTNTSSTNIFAGIRLNSTRFQSFKTTSLFDSVPTDKSSPENTLGAEMKVHYDLDAPEGANRVSSSFYLFHFSEFIGVLEHRFGSSTAASAGITSHHTSNNNNNNNSNGSGTATSKSGDKPVVSIWKRFVDGIDALWKQRKAEFYRDFGRNTATGLRAMFLMGIALIFVEVPALANKFEQGQWIIIAMIMGQGENFGGTLVQSRNRLFGTLLGAVYGYFVHLAVGDNHINSTIAMLIPIMVFSQFMKQNRNWGYFGTICGATAIIVTLGRVAYLNPVQGDYSLLRIQENVMGLLLLLAVSILSWPVQALELYHLNLYGFFAKSSVAILKIWKVYHDAMNSSNPKSRSNSSNIIGGMDGDMNVDVDKKLGHVSSLPQQQGSSNSTNSSHNTTNNGIDLVSVGECDVEKLPTSSLGTTVVTQVNDVADDWLTQSLYAEASELSDSTSMVWNTARSRSHHSTTPNEANGASVGESKTDVDPVGIVEEYEEVVDEAVEEDVKEVLEMMQGLSNEFVASLPGDESLSEVNATSKKENSLSSSAPVASNGESYSVANVQTNTNVNANAYGGCNVLDDGDNDALLASYSRLRKNSLFQELSLVDLRRQVQSIRYVAEECGFLRSQLAWQPGLLEQSSMEAALLGRAFPVFLYQQLFRQEQTLLRMIYGLDRSLLRMMGVIDLRLASTALEFAHWIAQDVEELLKESARFLSQWSEEIRLAQQNKHCSLFSISKSLKTVMEWICITTKQSSKAQAKQHQQRGYNSANGDDSIEMMEQGVSPASSSSTPVEAFHHVSLSSKESKERRRIHGASMERLHQIAARLRMKSHDLNQEMFACWLTSLMNTGTSMSARPMKKDVTGDNEECRNPELDANIHRLFDIYCAFNSLFYAISHLAHAVIEIGNTYHAIQESLEKRYLQQF